MLSVYLIQIEPIKGDKEENFKKVEQMILDIKPKEDSLIVLPEMFATGYLPMHPEALAENFSFSGTGKTAKFLSKLSKKINCAILGAGISNNQSKLTNHASLYVPSQDTESLAYDKIHPFFMEKEKFLSGKDITLFKMNGWNIATTICFDLRFPELYRNAVCLGANLFVVQAAWPIKRIDHWNTLLKARAIENQCYVLGVNCCSTNKTYGGCSQIISPLGEVIAKADSNKECILSGELSLEEELKWREEFPVLREIKLIPNP